MNNTNTTYDKILDSARTLIITGGFNGFSYADIAEAVGIRKASIHHHFPSKVDLVRTLLLLYREQLKAGIAEIDRKIPEPLEKLRAYTGYWEKCILDASAPICICALLASELPALPEELRVEIRAFFNSLSSWLTSVFSQGLQQQNIQIRSAPSVEAEAFMATIHGAMLSARAYGDAKIFGVVVNPLLDRISIHQSANA
jgi:TetR/AcrR family transcriptional repressor of nem operon